MAVLADGRRALSGSRDSTLRLWDLETGESLRTLQGHTDRSARWRCWRTGAAPSPALMMARCGCGTWRRGRACAPWKGTRIGSARWRCWRTGAAPSPALEDGTLRLWDLETGESLRTLEGHTDWVTAVAVLADGRRALSGS